MGEWFCVDGRETRMHIVTPARWPSDWPGNEKL